MMQNGRPTSGGAAIVTLAPGQLLAGRYRIVTGLGRGAVGEVYEAHDLELDERVAVKILRPEIAGSDLTLKRFKREIHLARKVTHPNVCRVFDLVYHGTPERGAVPGGGLAFLTMELLEGEPLSALLARRGRLAPAEALPIVRQVAAALAAAHAVGVVHRDLKSGNVFLVEATGGRRAVVTDFGLAASPPGEGAASLTATGELVGSPAYMAPEQVRGEEPTPATDVYALGVVLFEMVTGELPFTGKSAFYTALKRLQEPPPSPRALAPELDPAWEAVILRCLAREPADRFASAEDVAAALGAAEGDSGARAVAEAIAPAPPRRPRRAWWPPARERLRAAALIAAPAALLLALLGAVALLRDAAPGPPAARTGGEASPQESGGREGPLPAPRRRAVAVLGFRNVSGDPDVDHLGSALRHMLPTELAATGALRPVPAEEVERARRDLALEDSAGLSPASLSRLRARLRADLVVTGAYVVTGEEARYAVQAQDTRTGETVASLSESGPVAGFPRTLEGLGSRLRTELRAGDLPAATAALRAGNPRQPAAARLYAEGLSALDASEAPRARDLLLEAAAEEPANPRIHAALAAAWAALGYDERASAEARRASQLAGALPAEERQAIAARRHELAGEWPQAVTAYRRLASSFPDNLHYGLGLAGAQIAAGKADQAITTVAALRSRAAGGRSDPRLDLVAARAAAAQSDLAGQKRAAARAAAAAAALGARALHAQAKLEEGAALLDTGEYGAAAAALGEARRLAEEAGDPGVVAAATRRLGVVRYRQGDIGAAKRLYEAALAAYRELGSKQHEAQLLTDLANLVSEKERNFASARRLYAASLALHRETNNRRGMASVLLNLGNLTFWEGDLATAQRSYEEARLRLNQIGHRAGVAAATVNIGNVLLRRGELAAAGERLRDALRRLAELGDKGYMTVEALQTLAEVELQSGDLDGARRRYAAAAALDGELGAEYRAAGRIGEASLALEEGRAGDAEALARQALAALGREGPHTTRTRAHLVLARALLARRLTAGAEREAERAGASAAAAADAWLDVQAAIVEARVAAARGDAAAARRLLLPALESARRRGFAGQLLEARLALAELDLAAGAPAALAEVAADARRSGFGTLARRAERALGAGR